MAHKTENLNLIPSTPSPRLSYCVCMCRKRRGWSGGAKVLGKLPVPGGPTVWMIVGQGPIALAVGAGGGCLDTFTLRYLFSSLSLSLGGGPI